MSDAITSRLPRFNVASVSSLAAAQRNLMGKVEDETPQSVAFESAQSDEDVDIEEDVPLTIPADEFRQKIDHLNQLLQSVEQALHHINSETRSRAEAMASAFVAEVFPKLSEAFLVEEIVRHIPHLIPDSTPHLTMRLSSDLVEPVKEALSQTPDLAERIDIEIESNGVNQLQILWPQGGCDLNFGSLIDDIFRRLRPQAIESME